MAINCVPGSVPNTAVKLVDVPPGTQAVTITVAAVNSTFVYVGTGSGVTTTSGAPIAGGSTVTIPCYPGSKGTTLYAIGSVAGPTPVGVFLSTAQ